MPALKILVFEKGLLPYMDATGIRINPKYGLPMRAFKTLLTFYSLLVMVAHLLSMYYAGMKKSLNETAFFGMIGTLCSLQLTYFLFVQGSISSLFRIWDKLEESRTEHGKEIFTKESTRAWKYGVIYYWSCESYIIYVCMLPVLLDFSIGLIYSSFPRFHIPIALQGFIDMTEPRSLANFFVTINGVCWTIVCMLMHAGMSVTLYITIIGVRAELKIILQKLSEFKKVLVLRRGMKGSELEQHAYLRDIILHYSLIRR